MNKLFQRESDGSYSVSSSNGDSMYRVTMFGLEAMFCECAGNSRYGRHCDHMEVAEVEEVVYQQKAKEPPPLLFPNTELTQHAGFSLMKK